MSDNIELRSLRVDTDRATLAIEGDISIYSRSSLVEEACSRLDSLGLSPNILARPEPHGLDRDVAKLGGTTIALEATTAKIRGSKRARRTTKEERRWELEWHKHENRFFEGCDDRFRKLQAAAADISQDLMLQSYFEPDVDPSGNVHLRNYSMRLKTALDDNRILEAKAEEKYMDFWRTRPVSLWI